MPVGPLDFAGGNNAIANHGSGPLAMVIRAEQASVAT